MTDDAEARRVTVEAWRAGVTAKGEAYPPGWLLQARRRAQRDRHRLRTWLAYRIAPWLY